MMSNIYIYGIYGI